MATTEPIDVLIVDDQAPFRTVARAVVDRVAGWRVVGEAASGEEALSTAAEVRPTIVLMDINLPGINGIEATRRMLDAEPAVTIVLLSTYAGDDLPADARTCGAVAYVHKDELTPALLRGLAPT